MYGRAKQGVYIFWRFDFVYILILILQRTVSEAFYAGIGHSHLFNLMICDNINNGNCTLYLRFFNGTGGCLYCHCFFYFSLFIFWRCCEKTRKIKNNSKGSRKQKTTTNKNKGEKKLKKRNRITELKEITTE